MWNPFARIRRLEEEVRKLHAENDRLAQKVNIAGEYNFVVKNPHYVEADAHLPWNSRYTSRSLPVETVLRKVIEAMGLEIQYEGAKSESITFKKSE